MYIIYIYNLYIYIYIYVCVYVYTQICINGCIGICVLIMYAKTKYCNALN